MFTGIVEATSQILRVRQAAGQLRFAIALPRGWRLREGESVSVDGVCSTAQHTDSRCFEVVYMPETLRKTTLGERAAGHRVNLERSLTLRSLLGGHLVMGHVDTTAPIATIRDEGSAEIYEFTIAPRFSRYIVSKGSIAIDGTSLTVVESRSGRFSVSLLEYTLRRTTLGEKRAGDRVNIETDILAKYIEKLTNH